MNHFPVYNKTEDEVEAIKAKFAEQDRVKHFDSSRDVREMGPANYRFAEDEELRKQQQDALRGMTRETAEARRETGAVDVRPGEVEGMQAAEPFVPGTSRAQAKRRRELEERSRLLAERKRRKKGGDEAEAPKDTPPPPPPKVAETSAVSAAAPIDPFAALEAQTKTNQGSSSRRHTPPNAADAFLAQLEHDIMKGKGR